MDADTDADLIHRRLTKARGHGSECRIAAALNVEGRRYRRLGVVLDLDRKVEDSHKSIAHLLVHDAIVRLDGLSALVLEDTDDLTNATGSIRSDNWV